MTKHQSEFKKNETKIIQDVQTNYRKLEEIENELRVHRKAQKSINDEMQFFHSEISKINDSFRDVRGGE